MNVDLDYIEIRQFIERKVQQLAHAADKGSLDDVEAILNRLLALVELARTVRNMRDD